MTWLRPRHLHRAFAVASAAGLVASAAWSYQALQAASLARQIAAAQRAPSGAAADGGEVALQLAQAAALGRSGDWQAAVERYDAIAQRAADDPLAQDASYDAAQLLLSQAIAAQQRGDAARALPLAELAKQRLRSVLRVQPGAWDARYNLERALRIAPEEPLPGDAPAHPNSERRGMRQGGSLTPELP